MKTFKRCMAAVLALAATVSASSLYSTYAYTNTQTVTSTLTSASAASVIFTAEGAEDEVAYAEWNAVSNATGYNVYVKKGSGNYTQIDIMLIRQYASCFRADAVGLAAGTYTLKVVPVIGGKEDTSKAAETSSLTVTAADRSGFAFQNSGASIGSGTYGCGGYQADGTLASDAQVVYITADTVNTVKLDVVTNSKGSITSCTGIAEILTARKKGYDLTPLVIRMVGEIKASDISGLNSNGYLEIKGCTNVTLEGIGKDATVNGWGLLVRDATNVEIKNVGVMLFPDDGISLDTANSNVWVHNCDIFYGTAGSDADQAKGDGSMDVKKDSKYITFSYNHFWDSGKCSLCGMTSETGENWITYHHNWFDHSDSRHPRIRTMSVHVYNNYYDGNAKYGVGVTMGASCFVENNYFRNCKYPMLSSMQGSDADGEGTFSGEDGGIIKSFGNYIEGAKAVITQKDTSDKTDIDCYEASSRTEIVPADYKTAQGGTIYNNFDTGSSMYSYPVDDAKSVPSVVTSKAGRTQGGDFRFAFDNAVDDASYSINTELMSQVRAYKTSVIAIGSGFTDSTQEVPTEPATQPATEPPTNPVETDPIETKPPVTPSYSDIIYCSPDGNGSGKTTDDPANVLSALNNVPAGGVIYLLEGTYKFSEPIIIDQNNNGEAGAVKTISAYQGADVTFDFSAMEVSDSNRGVVLDGSYWHWYGFEITKAGDNGMLLSGSNNTIEMMVFNDNQDTGLQISRYRTNAASIAEWPSNNLILNCTSKNNCDDASMENADGFAAKLTCGEGNVFDGCMAYNNSDDGWDLFAKEATGPIGVVTIRNSIAFRNGYTEFGEGYGDCDGNGFKLGGSGIGSAHVVENCLAFENLHCGFTDNNNPELGKLINCTAVNNNYGKDGKPNFSCYRCTNCDFDNLISYYGSNANPSNDKFVGTYANGIYYNSGYYEVASDTAVTNGEKIGTKFSSTPDFGFISTSVPAMEEMTDFHTYWRNADGSINTHGFYVTTGAYSTMGYKAKMYVEPTEPATDEPTDVPEVLYGDANDDGEVTIVDVVKLCRCAMGADTMTEKGTRNADVDGSGTADATDASYIIQSLVGLVVLPVQ